MKLSRRTFLGLTGATALVATCTPNALAGGPLAGALSKGITGATGDTATASAAPVQLKRLQSLAQQRSNMLGYPINMNYPPAAFFDWRQQLQDAGLNRFNFNNVGDPFKHAHFAFNTHDFEQTLIQRFARIYGFQPNTAWGFLSNSGTDSNMHGIYFGRTLLHSRTGIMPKIYFTREAHYSIQILANLLNLEWVSVATHDDGSMDADDLERRLKANPDHPALVVATIGTTFKGAIDSIDEIQSKLKGRESYFHLDAALFGGYLPHTPFATELLHTRDSGEGARYHSIAVSCHKFFGFPAPAGLFITTQSVFDEFSAEFSKVHDPSYILQIPGTITCSRDAIKPAEFYFFSSDADFTRQAADAKAMFDSTDYLLTEMQNHFAHLAPVRTSNRSTTIYFKKPADAIVNRYTLATMTLKQPTGQVGHVPQSAPYAHIVVMPHINKTVIDRFLDDLSQFPSEAG